MRKVTTEYVCDRCNKEVPGVRDLERFALEHVRRGRALNESVYADLCADCESELLATVQGFFGGEALPLLHAMSRDEA